MERKGLIEIYGYVTGGWKLLQGFKPDEREAALAAFKQREKAYPHMPAKLVQPYFDDVSKSWVEIILRKSGALKNLEDKHRNEVAFERVVVYHEEVDPKQVVARFSIADRQGLAAFVRRYERSRPLAVVVAIKEEVNLSNQVLAQTPIYSTGCGTPLLARLEARRWKSGGRMPVRRGRRAAALSEAQRYVLGMLTLAMVFVAPAVLFFASAQEQLSDAAGDGALATGAVAMLVAAVSIILMLRHEAQGDADAEAVQRRPVRRRSPQIRVPSFSA